MRALLLALSLLPFWPLQAPAQEWLRKASTTSVIVDGWISLDAVGRMDMQERNPILGKHPSAQRVVVYTLVVAAANYWLPSLAPEKVRTVWWAALLGFQASVIRHQYMIGLRFKL